MNKINTISTHSFLENRKPNEKSIDISLGPEVKYILASSNYTFPGDCLHAHLHLKVHPYFDWCE